MLFIIMVCLTVGLASGVRESASRSLAIGVWQGVTMDSVKFHLGSPCPTPGLATPVMALKPFQEWPTRRSGPLAG
jgi:hypothetical protein